MEEFLNANARWILITLMVLIFVGVPIGVVMQGRASKSRLSRIRERVFNSPTSDDSSVSTEPCVDIAFHTYDGAFVFVRQTEHRLRLPASKARMLLWELHRYNLVHGLLAYGFLLIPLVSWINYSIQMRRVNKAEANGIYDIGGRQPG